MANYLRVLGRVTGKAIKSHAFDRALTAAADYIISEMKLTDLRAKRTILRRKQTNHLRLLGKTVCRLVDNDIEPIGDDHTRMIVRVLDEIGLEITAVEEELERRKAAARARKKGNGNETT